MKTLVSSLVLGLTVALTALPSMAAQEPAKAQQAIVKVNINQADAQTIAATLKGIGLKKAERIVAYRKANKKIQSVDELLAIKGIGEKTLAKIRHQITL